MADCQSTGTNLTGQRVGRLVVVKHAASRGRRHFWECRCDCGNTSTVRADSLKSGATQSCGCLKKTAAMAREEKRRDAGQPGIGFVDITGQRFGRLVVVDRAEGVKKKTAYWNCACDCGQATVVCGVDLRGGRTTSCGCVRGQRLVVLNYKHGNAGKNRLPEYDIWRAMIARCYNKTNPAYGNYGGRGIIVCERWRESFEDFLADMGPRTSSDHSIDRINNDGNYEPGNCRWATNEQQARNRRDTSMYTIGDKTQCLADWVAEFGHNYTTIMYRLSKGIPLEEALRMPRRK